MHPLETQRIESLHSLGLLDSGGSARYDHITTLVGDIFDVPTVLISLVDSNRQWFLSRCGMQAGETGRDVAFCSYAIHEEEILVVEDAAAHPIFCQNPLVTGEPFIQFYAGAVLRDEGGLPLGTLCLLDQKPRPFAQHQRRQLIAFAELARDEILLPAQKPAGGKARGLEIRRDPITQAFWGEAFFTVARRHAAANRNKAQLVVSVTFENLDFLREAHGRLACDEILVDFAGRIATLYSEFGTAVTGRLDGARLVTLIALNPGLDADDAINLCRDAIDREAAAIIATSSGDLLPKVAIALAQHSQSRDSIRNLIKLCGIAASRIPEDASGRSIVVGQTERLEATARFRIAADLPKALHGDDLRLVMQPKIAARTETVCGAECLIRWAHDQLGVIAPPEIIGAANDAHRLFELDTWVISRALRFLAQCNDNGTDFGRLSVNLSGATLANPSFPLWLKNTLRHHSIAGTQIDLEVVESSLFSDFERIVATMRKIRELGVSFSLDDFGTGYSSLSYLRELPIDNLKIDKSFVDDIADRPRAAALCAGIINLAGHLGMTSVAEGVETQTQHAILRDLNCDQIQGYYFSKPLEMAAFGGYLAGKA